MRARSPATWPDRSRARLEVAAVVGTFALHVFTHRTPRTWLVCIFAAAALWIVYLARRIRREPGLPGRWGLGGRGLARALALSSAVALPAAAGISAYASSLGRAVWTPWLFALLGLYPLWGLAQQFLLQALLASNVDVLVRSRAATTLVSAALFGLLHAPDPILSGLSFALALAFVPIYLATRNLYPLGFWHGVLGALAYSGVLGRDPLGELRAALG